MSSHHHSLLLAFCCTFLATALVFCGESTADDSPDTLAVDTLAPQPAGIRMVPVGTSPEFPDSKLMLKAPTLNQNVKPGKVKFDFLVSSFELGTQTDDAGIKLCANSGQGQHIHFILDNAPYVAYYTANFEHEIPAGPHVLLAFLSRSYHESLKHEGAYVLTSFHAGDAKPADFDANAPHLFYSRPKGEYFGADTARVLLDFYLVNTTLSPKGNKVIATINGESFTITEWKAFFIEGLPLGETTLRLELVDAAGKTIPSPFNPVERTITLGAEAPKS